ncbi:hypothetical protein PE066_13710 [Ramlibacter tataouinensis]|uniref:hypothetical protein n=1 Tax=Ramlibacter tataouinensis TaxID=94132 RepID=UPI0022F3CDCB|nr:hypothetical protein [Ramlibacter tataouinensis]WBY00521.1 hypothetical protein PE066_13710 [Ramlibacter tataouinensis]
MGTPFFDCGTIPRWADRRVWVADEELIDRGFGLAFYTFAPPGGVLCAEYLFFDVQDRFHCNEQPLRAWSGEINLRTELRKLLQPTALVYGVRGTEGMTFASPNALGDALYREDVECMTGGATLAVLH